MRIVQDQKPISIHKAAKKGDLQAFKKAMALGGNPLKAGTLSDSAFAIASNHGHTDILAHIFKNTQVPADMATSMLATALKDSRFEVAETCLQHGADPNHVVPGVGAPMHTLAVLGPDKPQLFAFLVQHGADTGLLNQKGESVLELASQFRKKKIVAWLATPEARPAAREGGPRLAEKPTTTASRPAAAQPQQQNTGGSGIKGLENLSDAQIRHELNNGARFVVFEYVISIILMTFKRGSEIHFVKSGDSTLTKASPYVLITLLLGWWGFPWGPIYSIGSIVTNLGGGRDVTMEVLAALNQSAGSA